MFNVPEISPQDLAQELESGRKLVLLDVRGDDELEISRIEGIIHIQMQEVPERLSELDAEADTVVICRVG